MSAQNPTYADYFPSLLPTFLADPVGKFWAQSFGTIADSISDSATNAVKCSIIATAPDDALPYLGAARPHVIRVPGQSAASYRADLMRSFEFASMLGTDAGIIAMLARAGLTARVVRNNQWDWDGHPGNVAPYWARMWVIIDNPGTWTAGSTWGGGERWGDTYTWGIRGLSADLIGYIIASCLMYKSSHARLVRIRAIVSGTSWGGGSTGGSWGTTFGWGGVAGDLYVGRNV